MSTLSTTWQHFDDCRRSNLMVNCWLLSRDFIFSSIDRLSQHALYKCHYRSNYSFLVSCLYFVNILKFYSPERLWIFHIPYSRGLSLQNFENRLGFYFWELQNWIIVEFDRGQFSVMIGSYYASLSLNDRSFSVDSFAKEVLIAERSLKCHYYFFLSLLITHHY